ncbi:hypothetical protein ACQP2E_33325 [Actinoplanes sp. CA-015351]|uniref:hypothetical protein n=1 Tax=Actinoplanes sp. CA-015351 TaxID=3239897 RepID=UPI003D982DBA
MSRLGRIVASVGGCALVLAVQACSSASTPSASPTSPAPAASSAAPPVESTPAEESAPVTEAPATEAPAGPGSLPGLNRQVVFTTVASAGGDALTVGSDGILELAKPGDRSLFVAVPVSSGAEKFLLKTGKLRAGGEAYCLQVHSPGGSRSLQIKIEACDASEKDQIFTFPEAAADSPGRLIEVAGLFVQTTKEGEVIAEESGDNGFLTNYAVEDRGKANIPALD